MVVASFALLVALSGTSIAAISNVPLLSVGTPQLKSNAVISAKVKNRTLLAVDFKQGQLPNGQAASGPARGAGPAGPQGPAGVAAPGFVSAVSSQTSGTTDDELDRVRRSRRIVGDVHVPAGETARIYAIFSAESACFGAGADRYCGVRIIVDGNELNPAVGNDFAFDTTDAGDEASAWESHAVARERDVERGNHTVKVQIRTTDAATTLRVDDWALVVYRTKLS